MRQLEITQRSLEELILAALKDDLSNVLAGSQDTDKQAKKDAKALKRVINFYSINPPYPEVK